VKRREANNKHTLEGITAYRTRCKDGGERIRSGRKKRDLTHLEDEAGIDNKSPKKMFKIQPNKEYM
jgi:hypothetical protein